MARSLNRVQLIGNLTRDPELRYTPNGTAVCSFSIATNRTWKTEAGEKREETEFHRIVSWNKLAELCSQFLTKGRKVYVEGRLTTRSWTGQDGNQRTTTEIVIQDMILLDRRPEGVGVSENGTEPAAAEEEKKASAPAKESAEKAKGKEKKEEKEEPKEEASEEVAPDDIPF
ncbi:MAG: single-stranded DNA-binding protein [Patescibacteria group bacterium]